jgi:ASC-1-like (ASCH) protein
MKGKKIIFAFILPSLLITSCQERKEEKPPSPEKKAELSLSAEPLQILADGKSKSKITAKGTDSQGEKLKDGEKITFTTSLGSFENEKQTQEVEIKDHKAIVYLKSTKTPGISTVTAESKYAKAEIKIMFVSPEGYKIVLKADPTIIPADGKSTSKITATLYDKKQEIVKEPQDIIFKTSLGTFKESGLNEAKVQTTEGTAEVNLISTKEQGIAKVQATFQDEKGNTFTNKVEVTFAQGPILILEAEEEKLYTGPALERRSTKITATLIKQGQPAPPGTEIEFMITSSQPKIGSFRKGEDITKKKIKIKGDQGKAEITFYSRETPGTATITATFGDTKAEIEITIISPNVSLNIEKDTLLTGGKEQGSTTISAEVTENGGWPVDPGTIVHFSIEPKDLGSFEPESHKYTADIEVQIQENKAIAETKFYSRLSPGQVTITARVGSGSDSKKITINSPPSIKSLESNHYQLYNQGKELRTATITATISPAQANIPINFSLSPPTLGSFSDKEIINNIDILTQNEGKAELVFYAGETQGTVTITAKVRESEKSIQIQISSPPKITLSSDKEYLYNNKSIYSIAKLEATVTRGEQNQPVQDTLVTFSVTPVNIGSFKQFEMQETITVKTNENGIAQTYFYASTSTGEATIKAAIGNIYDSVNIWILNPPNIEVTSSADKLYNDGRENSSAKITVTATQDDWPLPEGEIIHLSIDPPELGSLNSNEDIDELDIPIEGPNGKASCIFYAAIGKKGFVDIIAEREGVQDKVSLEITDPPLLGAIEFVSASPSKIRVAGTGNNQSIVTFRLLNELGEPFIPGVLVEFELSSNIGGTSIDPSNSLTDEDGLVQTTLYGGTVATTVQITAKVSVEEPVPKSLEVDSDPIPILGGPPSWGHFSFSCEDHNMPGLECNGVELRCTAYLADRFDNVVPEGHSVMFRAEAGAFQGAQGDVAIATTDKNGEATIIFKSQNPRPWDVPCVEWETNAGLYDCGANAGLGINPRDGWVTIIAFTTGEEDFIDKDGDGLYDSGEEFTDLGEPCVDANDNETCDWETEPYHDADESRDYTPENGRWDKTTYIWRKFLVVWSGKIDKTKSYLTPNGFITEHQQIQNLELFVGDKFYNPIEKEGRISISISVGKLISPDPASFKIGDRTYNLVYGIQILNNITGAESKTVAVTAKVNYKYCNETMPISTLTVTGTLLPPGP